MNESPIFIHSLFRAGSTYLFKAFRRSDAGYWCYQESLHEAVIDANDNPEKLFQDRGEDLVEQLRHPRIDMPYFQELHDTWPAWKDALNASAIYGGYFAPPDADIGIPYWRALAKAAKGRAVFQECRTASRIGAIKEQLGGYHIYLWRNPWDQWWSYKVAQYFDVANQLIVNANDLPVALQMLRSALGFEAYSHREIAGAFAHFWVKPLSAEESYLIFYMLWCLGLQQGRTQADLMLNIDTLSDSSAYRDEVRNQLENAGISAVDFSDCQVPQGAYCEHDRAFFGPLEDRVHYWLEAGGWSQDDLDQVQALRQQFQPASWGDPVRMLSQVELAEQAGRARALARRFETNLAELSREGTRKVAEAETRALQAEGRSQQEAAKAEQVESRAQQSATRAQQAEARAQQAEARAQQAEARAQQAEARAQQAEARAQQEAARAEQVESRAQQSETRAQQAEARAQQEVARAEQVENRALQSETRAQQAEARVWELEQRVAAIEVASHHGWQQANEWHERILALHRSTSWKVTKPVRALGRILRRQSTLSEVSSVSTAILRQFVRTRAVSTIKRAGDLARRSPGFKRFAFRLLRGYPRFQQELRRVYLGSEGTDQPQPVNWSGTSTDSVMPLYLDASGNKEYVMAPAVPHGINANQRTPLESSFHTYCGQP